MRFYPHKTPAFLRYFYPDFTWRIPTPEQPVLYLTFDDGPVPEATPYVLDMLEDFNARATFFMVGENVDRHPDIAQRVREAGHGIGNHTYRHLSGWRTNRGGYMKDIRRCDEALERHTGQKARFFRPPYGRITFAQARDVVPHYKVIMWEFLSGDFDLRLDVSSALRHLSQAEEGAILVFHDSRKYLSNVKMMLAPLLEEFRSRKFQFEALPHVN